VGDVKVISPPKSPKCRVDGGELEQQAKQVNLTFGSSRDNRLTIDN
jgi:hypothetical protein